MTAEPVRRAWANRGYSDGRAGRKKIAEIPGDCRDVYAARYRVGQHERRKVAARTEVE